MEDIKEKTADEMFEELGYEKYKEDYLSINMKALYGNKEDKRICFWIDKSIEVYDYYDGSRDFTLEELQAINKKCLELRLVRR